MGYKDLDYSGIQDTPEFQQMLKGDQSKQNTAWDSRERGTDPWRIAFSMQCSARYYPDADRWAPDGTRGVFRCRTCRRSNPGPDNAEWAKMVLIPRNLEKGGEFVRSFFLPRRTRVERIVQSRNVFDLPWRRS